MSYSPYTPWSSEGSPKEETRGGGGWWKNFKKPWKWRSSGGVEKKQQQQQPEPLYTATTPEERRERFGAFPPMISQLMFLQERRSSEPLTKPSLREPATEDASEEFELPHYEGQKRPRLDNIFPMHDPLPVDKIAALPPVDRPRLGGVVSTFGDGGLRGRERVGRGEEREEVDGGGVHVRGASVDSTGSEERSLERRNRRMGVVRKIPQLPQRRLDWNDAQSLPEFGHRRHQRPTPAPAASPFDRRVLEVPQHHYRPFSPSRGTRGHDFGYTPWGSPPENLPTLSEESESGDIKGFDDFKLY